MSKLDELIQQLCPDGVKYRKLEDIGVFENVGIDKKTIPGQPLVSLLNYVDVYKNIYIDNSIPQMIVSSPINKIKACSCEKGDIFITPTSETKDDIGHASVITETLENTVYSYHIMRFRLADISMTTSFYIRYLFDVDIIKEQIYKLAKGLTRYGLSKNDFAKIEIPLPPLPVQEEIVRLLDQLTETTQKYQAELEAEQDARKKQYEEYLNSFFGYDFDDLLANKEIKGYQIMPLSELGILTRGKRFVRDDVKASGQPCIHYGDLYTHYGIIADVTKTYLDRDFPKKMRYAQKGDVVIVGAGENDWDIGIGLVWNGEEPAAVHDACYILQHQMNPKYISYYLRSACYHLQIKKYVSTGKICSISSEGIGKALIPIPSLEKQQRIVNILDRMDKAHKELCQSIETEIRMRKQQYEYYRNQLLDFKKKEE